MLDFFITYYVIKDAFCDKICHVGCCCMLSNLVREKVKSNNVIIVFTSGKVDADNMIKRDDK